MDEEESSLPLNHFKGGGGQSNISGNAAGLASWLRRNQKEDDHHHHQATTTTTKATTTTTDTNKDITISPSGIAIISASNIIQYYCKITITGCITLRQL